MNRPTRRLAVLGVLVAVLGFGSPAAPAHADYNSDIGNVQCPGESWDEATQIQRLEIPKDSSLTRIRPVAGTEGTIQGDNGPEPRPAWIAATRIDDKSCLFRPRPVRMEIVSAKKLDIDLGRISHRLNGPNGEHTQLVLDLRPSGHEPTIVLPIGRDPKEAQKVRLTRSGIDINGDGQEDITILAKGVKWIRVFVGGEDRQRTRVGAADDVRLVASDTTVVYREFQVHTGPGDDRIVMDMPTTRVHANGYAGNDRLVVRGKSGGASGGSGNDFIDARRMTGRGIFNGDAGNDRVLFGPRGGLAGGGGSGTQQQGNDTYIGGRGADVVWDFHGVNTIRLGAGSDQAMVRGGPFRRDVVSLGAGNDTLGVLPRGRVRAILGAGNDKVVLFGDSWKYNFINCGAGRRDWIRAIKYTRTRNCELYGARKSPKPDR